jgi:hypothetical protein
MPGRSGLEMVQLIREIQLPRAADPNRGESGGE